jgi:hypothetical protein
MVDLNGDGQSGLTDVVLEIWRKSDGKYFDFDDQTFKSVGWTTRQGPMTELNATYSPGVYYYDFDTTTYSARYTEEGYFFRATSVVNSGLPIEGILRVGGFVDQIGVFEGGVRGGSEGMKRTEMVNLAKMVWDVILKGKDTAKDILLSKSEFDAAVDKVILKDKIDVKPVVLQQKAMVQAQKDYAREFKQLLIAVKGIKMEKPTDYLDNFKKLEKICMAMPDKLAPVLDKIRTGVRDIQGAKDDMNRQKQIAEATTRQVGQLMDQMNKVAEEMTKVPEEVKTAIQEELPKLDKRFREIQPEIL